MMMLQHLQTGLRESPAQAIARVASVAAPRRLLLVLSASVAVLAVSANAAAIWPFVALGVGCAAGATAVAALWGMVAHAAAARATRPLLLLARILAVIGTALAGSAVVALLLALLGDPWQL
jgi:hypothetical protein